MRCTWATHKEVVDIFEVEPIDLGFAFKQFKSQMDLHLWVDQILTTNHK